MADRVDRPSRHERTGSSWGRRCVALAALLSLVPPAPAASAEAIRNDGWWVVVASVPQDQTPDKTTRDHDDVVGRLKPCGAEPFNDVSGKFSGFRPGFIVFVLGAFATRDAADRMKDRVRACAPGAYVKAARYAGE